MNWEFCFEKEVEKIEITILPSLITRMNVRIHKYFCSHSCTYSYSYTWYTWKIIITPIIVCEHKCKKYLILYSYNCSNMNDKIIIITLVRIIYIFCIYIWSIYFKYTYSKTDINMNNIIIVQTLFCMNEFI